MIYPNIRLAGEFKQFEPLLISTFPDIQRFKKNQLVSGMDEDRSKYCYYVLSGSVACNYIDEIGGRRCTSVRGEGTVFPLYYTYTSTSIERTLEFEAMSPVVVIRIPKKGLLKLMEETPAIAIAMLDAYGKYATYLNYLVEASRYTLREKICSFLFLHADTNGEVWATHEQIADSVGATRENVSKAVVALRKEGLVATGRGKIRILDEDRIRSGSGYAARVAEGLAQG